MSMTAEAHLPHDLTAEAFFAWADTWDDGERYELIDGHPVRLQSEQNGHAEHKASAWLAVREGLKAAGLSTCRSFPDGVSVQVNDRTVREPDALVHWGPYASEDLFFANPIVVVEVISPSSIRSDPGRKLLDYFSVPSIQHYLINCGNGERVVHHRRIAIEGDIST